MGEQIVDAVAELTRAAAEPSAKAGFLAALADKGETIVEIAAFARALRDMSIAPPIDPATRACPILDVCGTGGDRLNTFNISTTVALMMASAGVSVAKHGNRAVTSRSGSADVLEALGIKIDLTPAEAAASLRDRHFAFFFAPDYHPAFKEMAAARQLCGERGQRTIFNFLGPLLNPARPTHQLLGVPQRELCPAIARVLETLGVQRGMVVCGSAGQGRCLDELSILGDNCAAGFPSTMESFSLAGLPLQPAVLADLTGGDRHANAAIIRRILRGAERGPKRDAVLINCAAALVVMEKCRGFAEGWGMAAELIDSGRANAKLKELTNG